MGTQHLTPTGPSPLPHVRRFSATEPRDDSAWRGGLDRRRVALAGGIWSLLLYALCVALIVGLGYPPTSGMLPFRDAILPGLGGGAPQGIALGFPLAFLYGAGGAWLFAAIYNLMPARRRAESEAP